VADSKVRNIQGVDYQEHELRNIVLMCEHPGYESYRRLFAAMRREMIDGTLGAGDVISERTLHHAQGAWGKVEDFERIPEDALQALEEIEDEKQAEEKKA